MTPSDAWTTLGIEATEDERAIRVAYSTRLKAFDPDSDPQAFVALREARDFALHRARRTAREAQAAGEPQQHGEGVREAEAIPEAELHARELHALFYADRASEKPNATKEEREAMLAHWAAITADPRLQEIGFFAQLEQWTIGLIAHHLPLSDPLIIPATELFGWTASDDTVAQSREVSVITARYGWLSYIDEVQDPDHPWHPLWEELNKPGGPGAKRGRLGPARVRTLLHAVRAMRPDLEEGFDPDRIALWEPQNPDFSPATPQATGSHAVSPRSAAAYLVPIGLILFYIWGVFGLSPPSPPPPHYDPYEQSARPAPPQMPMAMPGSQTPQPFVVNPNPAPMSPEQVIEALRKHEKKYGPPKSGDQIFLGNMSE